MVPFGSYMDFGISLKSICIKKKLLLYIRGYVPLYVNSFDHQKQHNIYGWFIVKLDPVTKIRTRMATHVWRGHPDPRDKRPLTDHLGLGLRRVETETQTLGIPYLHAN